MIPSLTEQVEEATRYASGEYPRIPLGFPFFDHRTGGGGTYGEFLMFIARTGVGKTFWLANVLANNPDVPAVFFSLEMAARAMVVRLAAVVNDVPDTAIKRALAEQGGSPTLDKLPSQLPNLVISDEPSTGLRGMGRFLEEYKEQTGNRIRIVAIDYLELIKGAPGMDKAGQVADIARDLKTFSRMHDVFLIVLHQVPRGEKVDGVRDNGHLPLSMFSGRYGGEDAADYLMGAYRPHLDPKLLNDPEADIEGMKGQFMMQFMKTRGGHEIHPHGCPHRINPDSGKIRALSPSVYEQSEIF